MALTEREIWLHIGLPKCGSTSVQRYFTRHYEADLHCGLCYPHAFRDVSGYRNHLPLARLAPEDLDAAMTAVAEEAANSAKILLSCEAWGKGPSGGNLLPLVAAIREIMPDRRLRIVAYFRNIYAFVESSYAQFLKAGLFGVSKAKFFRGGPPGLERFLQMFEEHRGFPLYSNLGHARDLLAHLPREVLSLRSIEPADLPGQDMVRDLCGLLGVGFRGNMGSLNRRASDGKIAELEFMQTVVDQKTFARMRRDLMKLELGADVGSDRFRSASLHIGPELHQRMARTAAEEQNGLAALFDTDVGGLYEDRWTHSDRGDRLSDADRAALIEFAASYR